VRLKGRVAIITGGGSGIGFAYAERFVTEGAAVVVAEVSAERGADAVDRLRGRGEIDFVPTDIANEDSAAACVAQAVATYGRLDVLVNNAALSGDMEFGNTTLEYARRIFDVNLFGQLLMTRAAAEPMAAQRSGRIINVASEAAYQFGGPGRTAGAVPGPDEAFPGFVADGFAWTVQMYAMSKAAVLHLTKVSAVALGPWGITVNCICPGLTSTDGAVATMGEEGLDRAAMARPLRRRIDPSDQAGTAVYLASDDASVVTGQIIVVDGGGKMPG
jgi:NAD(P)-dependent dehydrogenase (short-subunit alcohol dehydrogenase family)